MIKTISNFFFPEDNVLYTGEDSGKVSNKTTNLTNGMNQHDIFALNH